MHRKSRLSKELEAGLVTNKMGRLPSIYNNERLILPTTISANCSTTASSVSLVCIDSSHRNVHRPTK